MVVREKKVSLNIKFKSQSGSLEYFAFISDERITTDGIPDTVYNGIPDWVYEEEVLSTNKGLKSTSVIES